MSKDRPFNRFQTEEYRLALEEERRQERDERWADVPTPVRLLLALAPAFTPSLVERLADFPAGRLRRLFDHLAQNPRTDEPGPGLAEPVLALEAPYRDELLAEYLASPEGRTFLRDSAGKIGQDVLRLEGEPGVPSRTARWAKLAAWAATDNQRAARALDTEVEAAIGSGDRADEVFHWIEAARPLADLLTRDRAPELELALQRAGRRLELHYRRRRDAQLLETYLRRPEQDAAYFDLIRPGAAAWALHYRGEGGSGKTMLLRHIAAELRGAPTARSGRSPPGSISTTSIPTTPTGLPACCSGPSPRNFWPTTAVAQGPSSGKSIVPSAVSTSD